MSVAHKPAQTTVGLEVTLTVGRGLTTRVTVRVPVQPDVDPITVYVVVTVGLTETGFPVRLPGFHEYVAAPVADNAAVAPRQMAVGLAEAVTVGFGTTLTIAVVRPMHPSALVPLTVYVVVEPGETFWLEPIRFPGFQVKETAPPAFRFTLVPAQMVAEDGDTEIVGSGFTLIWIVPGDAATQPSELVPVTEYTVAMVGHTTGPPFKYV